MKATGTNYCLGVEVIKKKLNIDLLICNTLDFETAYKTIDYNSKFFDFNKKIILSNRNESIEGYDIHNIGKFNLRSTQTVHGRKVMDRDAISLGVYDK